MTGDGKEEKKGRLSSFLLPITAHTPLGLASLVNIYRRLRDDWGRVSINGIFNSLNKKKTMGSPEKFKL